MNKQEENAKLRQLHKTITSMVDRRQFIRSSRNTFNLVSKLGVVGFLSALEMSCARKIDLKVDWTAKPNKEFDWEGFENWFRAEKLYNDWNPNLQWKHTYMHTFKDVFIETWTPGIGYSVSPGTKMVACADGQIHGIKRLRKRAGGKMVWVSHGNGKGKHGWSTTSRGETVYPTWYAHLDTVYVKQNQKVKRGQPIGKFNMRAKTAKLMSSVGVEWTDPENYGRLKMYGDERRNYMEYAEDIQDKVDLSEKPKSVMQDNLRKQLFIVMDLYKRMEKYDWDHKHPNTGRASQKCGWSLVEEKRFLNELYKLNPKLFGNLPKDEFAAIDKSFWNAQPLIYTVPFKKS